jgi:hypothetical protein
MNPALPQALLLLLAFTTIVYLMARIITPGAWRGN